MANAQVMKARIFSLDYPRFSLDYPRFSLDYRSFPLDYRSFPLDYPLDKTIPPLLDTSPSHEPYRYYESSEKRLRNGD